MPTRSVLLSVFLLTAFLRAQAPGPGSVFQAELAFARMAEHRGIRAAFLAWLAEDAVVFTPRMVPGREHYGRQADPGYLAWYPEAQGISASGDLAWSFGPWTYRPSRGEAVRAQGHFLSLWRKQADGRWRVQADIGVPHRAPESPIEPLASWDAPSGWRAALKGTDAVSTLRRKEADLSKAWAAQGGLALRPELSAEARLLRPGRLPMTGEAEIRRALEASGPSGPWEPARLEVAASGDLGWACGETQPDGQGATTSFLRIWRLDAGAWKVLFDVRLPHPAAPK